MKNKIRIYGIITIAVIGLTLIACGPPRLRGKVSIEGTPHIGNTLTANIESLGGSGIITYQWLRDGSTAIADTNSYTLQLDDRDAVITVTVVRSDNSGSVTSAPVTPWGYAIGDTGPGGGIVFYVDLNGFTMTDTGETAYYLEAAPENMPRTLAWASSRFTSTSIPGTGIAIGTGRQNTALILAIDANAPAALACRNYSNNGLTDWFLPSRDELNQLYRNRASVGNLGTSWFWSSSQGNNNHLAALIQNFGGGNQLGSFKDYEYLVRAVRAF
jgi:hypothetical protein